MSKYTADEMREAADNFWVGGVICEVKDDDGRVVKHIKHDAVIAMLRQAADLIEREEREKKYEYAERFINNDVCSRHYETVKGLAVNIEIDPESSIVRREVGEWEEIPNEG